MVVKLNTGQYISGTGHLALIGYVLFGGMFLRPDDSTNVAVQEVALISESEFAAMVDRSTAPESFETAPSLQAPNAEPAPDVIPLEAMAPPPARPQAPTQDQPEPQPEVSEDLVPPVEVDPTPPTPQAEPEVSLEDPGAGVPDRPDEPPTPKSVPRIADQAVTTPEPTPEISEAPVVSSSEEAESPEVVEERREEAAPQETTTKIVTEAEKPSGMSTSSRPKARPANLAARAQEAKREAEAKAKAAAEAKAAEAKPAPQEQTAETSDTADAVAEAAAAAAAALAATAGAPDRPVGPPLTAGEREGLRVSVSQCWNVGALSTDAMRTTITVGVTMNQDGTPQNGSIKLLSHSGGTEAGAQSAFEVARRAIIRCGARGFPLPVEKFDHWRNIEMTFDPEQMRFK